MGVDPLLRQAGVGVHVDAQDVETFVFQRGLLVAKRGQVAQAMWAPRGPEVNQRHPTGTSTTAAGASRKTLRLEHLPVQLQRRKELQRRTDSLGEHGGRQDRQASRPGQSEASSGRQKFATRGGHARFLE